MKSAKFLLPLFLAACATSQRGPASSTHARIVDSVRKAGSSAAWLTPENRKFLEDVESRSDADLYANYAQRCVVVVSRDRRQVTWIRPEDQARLIFDSHRRSRGEYLDAETEAIEGWLEGEENTRKMEIYVTPTEKRPNSPQMAFWFYGKGFDLWYRLRVGSPPAKTLYSCARLGREAFE